MGKEKNKKKKSLEDKVESKFSYSDPNSSYKAEIWLNKKGTPIYAAFGIKGQRIKKTYKDEHFDSAVKTIMIYLIDQDLEQFRSFRRLLDEDYFDMSENVRIVKMNRYDI